MSSSTIGLAILGAGIFAKEAHLPALAELDGFALHAVYSRSEASARALAAAAQDTLKLAAAPAAYFDVAAGGAAAPAASALPALLARADVAGVLVVLPITLQPAVVRAALAAGKAVLSEKPVAKDVREGARLVAEYHATYAPRGLVWRVAENFEAEPAVRAAAKAIADGAIGDVQGFAVNVANYVDENSKYWKTPWRTKPDYQGGFLLDGGVHDAAALRTLLPSPLAALSAHASLAKPILAPHDTLSAALRTAAGAHGTLAMTFAAPYPAAGGALAPTTYAVRGARGWLTLGRAGGQWTLAVSTVRKADEEEGPGELETREEAFESAGVREEIRSWLKALAGEDDGLGLGDPRNMLKDVALIEAALTSAGNEIDLVKLAAGEA